MKRLFDLCVSFFILLLFSPIMLIITCAVFISSGAPVLFVQNRIGKDGKVFNIIKFRTMKRNAPNVATGEFSSYDKYITSVGGFLRRTSLDELPQFFNVLAGKMSIVGPRPLIPSEKSIHNMRMRAGVYSIRPGITGLAQISGRDMLSDTEKFLLDEEYVKSSSLIKDIKIIFYTIYVILNKKGYREGKKRN